MKNILTLLLLISAFTSNVQRTMFTSQNNYVAPPSPPVLVTTAVTAITGTTATSGGTITSDGGFSDWYLPSREELTLLYSNRNSVGGFGTGKYYSSSELAVNGAYYAYYLNFSNGDNTRAQDKNIPSSVRAIRTF